MPTSISDNLKLLRDRIESTYHSEVLAAEQKRKKGLESLGFLDLNYAQAPREKLLGGPTPDVDITEVSDTPPTLKDAINEGIHNLVTFTKSDVVMYIEAKYPSLRAKERGDSIASMISRMNGKSIVKTREGLGRQPHMYKFVDGQNGAHSKKGGEES